MFSGNTAIGGPGALRRIVLGLLAIAWLNMAVLPCAMAFQGGEDCPHGPPAEDHAMTSHHGHGEVPERPSCETMQSDCCKQPAASVDTRSDKLTIKPVSDVVSISAPVPPKAPTRAAAYGYHALDPPVGAASAPPLHVLFCVYLD